MCGRVVAKVNGRENIPRWNDKISAKIGPYRQTCVNVLMFGEVGVGRHVITGSFLFLVFDVFYWLQIAQTN